MPVRKQGGVPKITEMSKHYECLCEVFESFMLQGDAMCFPKDKEISNVQNALTCLPRKQPG